MSLKDKVLFITGASRGIGKAIAIRAARDGAMIAIAAKTSEPHPKLDGTIHTAAEEIRAAGGKALPIVTDVRSQESVASAVEKTLKEFGKIDILINNASAISLTPTTATEMKRFDLMLQVNVRATFMTSKLCIPALKVSGGHILNLSPPLNFETRWFAPHVAYSISKYGMSLCVLGMAGELKAHKISVNALWPKTTIATAAIMNLLGGEAIAKRSRKPEILADAAHIILSRPPGEQTGQFFVDEEVLKSAGTTDFSHYAVTPGAELAPDFFV